MSAVQPYEAWLFFGAIDVNEVREDYARFGTDDDGWHFAPGPDDLIDRVTVIAVEMDRGVEMVWVLRDGKAERHYSWMVRLATTNKMAERVPA